MKNLIKFKLFGIIIIPIMFFSFFTTAQSISKITTTQTANTVCPVSTTSYTTTIPTNFGSCKIKWTVENGTINGSDNQRDVSVTWSDIPGAISKITVTFSGCESNNPNEGKSDSKSELILSVKNQAWGSYGSTVVVDYCTRNQVNLSMPRMYVQGTGGTSQVPLKEVIYSWTLPAGWREVGTGRTGNFGTVANGIIIEPSGCSLPGNVTVQGRINVSPIFCASAGPSATATINLISSTPSVTITVPQGYTGSRACDKNPVTFTALLNPSLSCVSSYSWTYPSGWSPISQSGNTITLRPSGNTSDAGAVRGNVNFTCGSSVSGTANITFITPVVAGSSLVCTSSTYTIQNAAANPIINWSTNTAGLSIDGAGTASIQNSYSGFATISATVCGAQATPLTVYVGLPTANNNTLIWAGTRGVNPITTSPGATYIFQGDNAPGATSYTWLLPNGFTTLGGSNVTSTPFIYITTSATAGVYTLYCQANNQCGFRFTRSLTINNGTSGGGNGCPPGVPPPCKPGPAPLRVAMPDEESKLDLPNLVLSNPEVYPNPANKSFTVNLVQEEGKAIEGVLDEPVELTLYNLLQQIVFQKSTDKSIVTIPVENLPSEVYVLSIAYKNKLIRKQLVIRK